MNKGLDSTKLLKKWTALRRNRVMDQIKIQNCLYGYSWAARRKFKSLLTSLVNENFEGALGHIGTLSAWSEQWYFDMADGERIAELTKNTYSKADWDYIDSELEENKNEYLKTLRDLIGQSDGIVKSVLVGAEILLKSTDWKKDPLSSLFQEDCSRTVKTIEQMTSEIGGLACRSLFAEVCVGIPYFGKGKLSFHNLKQKRDMARKALWKALSQQDLSSSTKSAKNLVKLGQQAARLHCKNISTLQKVRTETDSDEEKENLAKQELVETKMMKQSGLDYATGLYFTKVLGFAKRKYAGLATAEFIAASKLPFESEERWTNVSTKQLLEKPDNYDGKLVQVEGVVSSLREKKSQTGPVERVFSIFDLTSDSSKAEAYYAQYWLRDNGLEKGAYVDVCGHYNRSCPDVNRPDIHLIRLGLEERAKKDWTNRCRWLIRDWWDGFTDRTPAEWTLGTLNPEPKSFGLSMPEDNEYSEDLIQSVRKTYPSVRAALRALKEIVRGPLMRNVLKKYRAAQDYQYLRGFMIDLFILMTLIQSNRKPITRPLSRITIDTTQVPWIPDYMSDQRWMFGVDEKLMEINLRMDWLEYSLENYGPIGGA